MSDFFGRFLEITVFPKEGKKVTFTQEYKIIFDIDMFTDCTNNKSIIKIYNPSESDIDLITSQAGNINILLDAGYNDRHGEIFTGTIMNAVPIKENGVDIVLHMWCWTQPEKITEYRINQTFNKGITNIDLTDQIARTLTFINRTEFDPEIEVVELNYNPVKIGRSTDFLTELGKQYDFVWQIYGNTMKFEKRCTEKQPYLINEKNGLIGIPQKTIAGASCRIFLDHRLKINDKIDIECEYSMISVSSAFVQTLTNTSVNGSYYIHQLKQSGDTRGDAWYSDITSHTIQYEVAK